MILQLLYHWAHW